MVDANRFYGWRVVAALWVIIFINLGFSNYGGGMINAVMANDLHFDRSILGLGFTAMTLGQGLAAPGVAWGVNRIGSRLTICFGSMVVALGAFLLAYMVTQPWHYVLAFGVTAGLGCGLGAHLPAQACIALWFERKRGVALSIALAATGIGGFVAAPLLNRIIAASGGDWRAGWYFIALLALLAGVVSLLFVKNRPADYGQLPDGQIVDVGVDTSPGGRGKFVSIYRSPQNWLIRDALKTRAMWLITFASISFVIPLTVFIAHSVLHLRDLGHSATEAAMALGGIALCSIVGKLGAGFLCDRFEPRHVWAAAMVLTAAGVLLAIGAKSSAQIYLFSIFVGAGYGASMVCFPAIVANYFGSGALASMLGVQVPIITAVASAAPFIVGLTYDAQLTYNNSFMAIAALALGAGVLLLLATPPQPQVPSVTNRVVETA